MMPAGDRRPAAAWPARQISARRPASRPRRGARFPCRMDQRVRSSSVRAQAPPAATSHPAKVVFALCGAVCGLVIVEVVLRFAMPSLDFHFPTMRITDERFTERAGKTIEGNG